MIVQTFTRRCLLLLATLGAAGSTVGQLPVGLQPAPGPLFRAYRRPITIWVPPYGVDASRTRLNTIYGGARMRDSITHLALQFWVPTSSGGLQKAPYSGATDASAIEMRDLAHASGARAMLCVYNVNPNTNQWDWNLARSAFANNRQAFVQSLVAEMERLQLDGIDIDLEGGGDFESDKSAFIAFMTELSQQLRARSKHLTVDTFSYIWNAPNQNWWPQLFPLVDHVASMGYDETGRSASDWRSYAAQKSAAGSFASKLQLGLPSYMDQWQGNTAIDQLNWIRQDGTVGLAIWDAQLQASAWQTGPVWQAIRDIRGVRSTR